MLCGKKRLGLTSPHVWIMPHAKVFSEDVKEVPGVNLTFLDNLDGQTKPAFQQAMKQCCNSVCHFLTAGATDEIHVVDGPMEALVRR